MYAVGYIERDCIIAYRRAAVVAREIESHVDIDLTLSDSSYTSRPRKDSSSNERHSTNSIVFSMLVYIYREREYR